MSALFVLFTIAGVLTTAIAIIAVAAPRALVPRVGALAAFVVLLAIGWLGAAELLGRPKDVALEWLRGDVAEARVVASHVHEGKAIYMWLELAPGEPPRAYRMPWVFPVARQLHEAGADAEEEGAGLMMSVPFGDFYAGELPVFHVPPPEPLPSKDEERRLERVPAR